MKQIIESVVAITPVWNESLGMIQKFQIQIEAVRQKLNDQGIGFLHFFLDDGALHLPQDFPILVSHKENQRLAQTLVDGYEAVLSDLKTRPDLVVRIDCQEHDPSQILFAIDHFSKSQVQALFLPVWYWIEGQSNRPLMREITRMIANFCGALAPMNQEVILSTYNQLFPIGYQIFRTDLLEKMLPDLEKSLGVFKREFDEKASWGLDLLAILLAAERYPDLMDFAFGGWSTPWQENRGDDKIKAQKQKAEAMIKIAQELGCELAEKAKV